MKFRFYIASTINGEVYGTDDETVARYWAESEDGYVIDTVKGKHLSVGFNDYNIPEAAAVTKDDEEVGEDPHEYD